MNNKNMLEEDFFYSITIKNLEKFKKTACVTISKCLSENFLDIEDKGDIHEISGRTS